MLLDSALEVSSDIAASVCNMRDGAVKSIDLLRPRRGAEGVVWGAPKECGACGGLVIRTGSCHTCTRCGEMTSCG